MPPTSQPIRVMLVDGQRWSCAYLMGLCAQTPDLNLVAAVGVGADVVERVATLQPAVVVLDSDLPDFDVGAAVAQLAALAPRTHIVLLLPDVIAARSQHLASVAVTSMVLRGAAPETLLEIIRAAARGDGLFQREVVPYATPQHSHQPPPLPACLQILSHRQCQVLQLIGQHRSNRAIADELGITEDTVKKHLKHVFDKLNVTSRRDAAYYAQFLATHSRCA